MAKRNTRNKNKKWVQILILLILAIAAISLVINPFIPNKTRKSTRRTEIKFKKQGVLSFLNAQDNNKSITTIDIEVADDEFKRNLGLMYRYSINDRVGMLFIMESETEQSFWMKNTYISLDIIYVNSNFEIVKIQKYTEPLTEHPIPSVERSKYVVEVIAGFCDKNNIEEGDFIKFKRTAAVI